eukprot:3901727-Amphidinium_carterae.1
MLHLVAGMHHALQTRCGVSTYRRDIGAELGCPYKETPCRSTVMCYVTKEDAPQWQLCKCGRPKRPCLTTRPEQYAERVLRVMSHENQVPLGHDSWAVKAKTSMQVTMKRTPSHRAAKRHYSCENRTHARRDASQSDTARTSGEKTAQRGPIGHALQQKSAGEFLEPQ